MQRVLLVDSRSDNRMAYELALRRAGFEVESVVGGSEAVDRLGSGDFDVILTDVVLSDMSGYEVCRWVRSSTRSAVPVLIVSSLSGEYDISEGFRAGASGYLVGPASPMQLTRRVRQLARA